jgi:hypothetical protein
MTTVCTNYYNINKFFSLPHIVFYVFYMIITTNKLMTQHNTILTVGSLHWTLYLFSVR